MAVSTRKAQSSDATECGRIVHAAFAAIAAQHNFPPDFPSVQSAVGIVSMLITHPGFYGIVAENEGRIVGSNFLDMRSRIGGIGPITIDPLLQNKGIGQQLMRAVMERASAKNMPGIRLVQDSFHNRSLSLYTRLGFVTREPLSVMQGPPIETKLTRHNVRPAQDTDLDACSALCSACMAMTAMRSFKTRSGRGPPP
jgi:predicted N-acetyltransferase YhbS